MPKNTYHEDWGIGEWSGNNPQADIDPVTQTELGPRFPIYRGSSDFNLNKVLLGNVQRNNYFKQLVKFTTFKEVVDQIYYQVEFITPWEPGSHSNKSAGGMCSQIQILTQHPDSPFLRGIGFLFLRYCCDPKQLWAWFQPSLKDPEEMQIRKFDKRKGTVGQFLCEILINVEYEATHFPRIPIPLHKRMLAEIESMGLKGLSADVPDDDRGDRDDRHGGRYRDSRQRNSDRGRHDSRDSGRRDSRGYGGRSAEADADRSTSERDKSRSRGRRSRRSRSRGRDRRRDRSKDRDRGKDRDRDRDRDRGRRHRDRDRDRGRDRDRDRDRDRSSYDKRSSRDRSADADRTYE